MEAYLQLFGEPKENDSNGRDGELASLPLWAQGKGPLNNLYNCLLELTDQSLISLASSFCMQFFILFFQHLEMEGRVFDATIAVQRHLQWENNVEPNSTAPQERKL